MRETMQGFALRAVGAAAAAAVGVTLALPSTPAAAATTPGWVLHGAGWGHGIGMSQYGAMEMAKDGRTAKEILAHYYRGTTYDAVGDNVLLNVNLMHAVSSATLQAVPKVSGGPAGPLSITVFSSNGTSRTTTVQPAGSATLSRSTTDVKVVCTSCTPGLESFQGVRAEATWNTSSTLVSVSGSRYDTGRIIVTPTPPATATTIEVVNRVRLHDEYLDHIRETPWSWPLEARKAQAAAARGYALTKYGRGLQSTCNCHLYDTTADQVYGTYPPAGDLPYWQGWKDAVRATGSATTGYVARYGGAIIQAFYSSSSGGRTENNEDVWGGTALPYLRGVSDPYSLRTSNPNRAWTQVTVGSSMASVFGLTDVVRLDLRDRTANGGIKTATATSSAGVTKTITGDRFRGISTTSAAPYVKVRSTTIRHLTGRLAGTDRYASAAAVARRVPSSAAVVIAGGDTTLSDASVSGPLATTVGGPLLLTQRAKLPAPTVAELDRRGSTVRTAYIVGGTGVVSEAVASQLRARGLTVQRLGGRDRYQTSELVAKAIRARRSVPSVVIAGGLGLPDALGASGPASALREPIILTPQAGLAAASRAALIATGAKAARVVGGPAVVGAGVEAQLKAAGVTTVNRLGGADRYAVSGSVASFYRGKVPTTAEVVLTSGADTSLVDSLVAGTLQRLMVLTNKSSLVEPAAAALQSTPGLGTVTAVGGTGSLSAGALAAAANS